MESPCSGRVLTPVPQLLHIGSQDSSGAVLHRSALARDQRRAPPNRIHPFTSAGCPNYFPSSCPNTFSFLHPRMRTWKVVMVSLPSGPVTEVIRKASDPWRPRIPFADQCTGGLGRLMGWSLPQARDGSVARLGRRPGRLRLHVRVPDGWMGIRSGGGRCPGW